MFSSSGSYYFCWKSPLINYDGYILASDSYWLVKEAPKVPDGVINNYVFNRKIETIDLVSEVGKNDELELFSGVVDWDISNKEEGLQITSHRRNLYAWFPQVL